VVWRDRSRLRVLALLVLLLSEVEGEVDGVVVRGCYRCGFAREGSWFIFPSGINFGMSDEAVLFVWEISRQNKRHSVSDWLLWYDIFISCSHYCHHCRGLNALVASMYEE